MEHLKAKTRKITDKDLGFVLNSWLKSYRNSDFAKHVPNDVFFDEHKAVIGNLLKKAKLEIVCNSEDEDQIYGYVCHDRLPSNIPVIHYAYFKYSFRHLGLAHKFIKQCVPEFGASEVFITHCTKAAQKTKDSLKLIYIPYLLGDYYEN